MAKLKFYALCCRNMLALKRHNTYIPKEDLHIVINTQDDEFKTSAVAYCSSEGIEHTVTVSDGTPATGKNSVLDLFNSSDNDYMVLVDGDDFITPHGVVTYKKLAESESPPDLVALEYQFVLSRNYGQARGFDPIAREYIRNPYHGCSDKKNFNTIAGWGCRGFQQPKKWWNKAREGHWITPARGDKYLDEFGGIHKRWANLCYDYINNWETHCRLVWWSKKAVQNSLRFDPNYIVGEDTLLYFEYKHEHFNNNLVVKHLFDRWPTYVYDCRVGGIVQYHKHKDGIMDRGWMLWLEKLTSKYEELEAAGKMHINKLPYVTVCTDPNAPDADTSADIVWDEGYIPDICKLVLFPGKERLIFH